MNVLPVLKREVLVFMLMTMLWAWQCKGPKKGTGACPGLTVHSVVLAERPGSVLGAGLES